MKVLFLTNIPSPYRVDFFHKLSKYCDLTVLYEMKSASDRNELWKKEEEQKSYQEVFLKSIWRGSSSAWCPSVKTYLKDPSFEVVVVGGYSTPTGMEAVHYLRRKKIPYILNSDGGLVPNDEKKWKRKLKEYFISSASAWLSTGKLSDEYLIHYGADAVSVYHYPFTSLKKENILETPVTSEGKQKLRAQLGMKEEKIVLSVGSFIFRKGFDLLIEAARHTEDKYGIYVVGGNETAEYTELLERYGLQHVHFLPFKEEKILRQYYMVADIFVLPTREDIWGLVINEAMAAGLPVVTTDRCVAGLELIDGNGLIVPSEDASALAEGVERILCDSQLTEEMSKRSLEIIREYSIENMAICHRNIFEEILNGDRNQR